MQSSTCEKLSGCSIPVADTKLDAYVSELLLYKPGTCSEEMKYHNLYIDFEPSWETYHKVTEIMRRTPQEKENTKFDESEEPSMWWLQLVNDEEKDEYLDFVSVFLDLLEPNFEKLKKLGIQRENILIWLVYEYQHQCALGFNAEELERLGKNGISLNIDCHERKVNTT